ncbi:putative quinol monooxygenase [Robiginitalea biformata]|uniref:ABM domain-containing protein n=1 Tax=Robiginitalea biformata (strain ATCC BAA-864 / DSM 15991 / KCTC 12146 / HTCC2501) TaxID=313596 RepID=A4CN48_ROBBH|nr:antibiotic biosynthesis monooxygenase family protein [Robiginitalea biformata]EAR15090.1 hypothetical protein RB2501_12207 [Robiginitalea biformata HTCC2501]
MNKLIAFLIIVLFVSCNQSKKPRIDFDSDKVMIRLSEIQIEPEYLEEYLSILKEEARASVELEPGVISIFPMYQKENPTQIRILEIYADEDAYRKHLESPHFKQYKTTTLNMVKSLNLIDMNYIDEATMPLVFKKIK